MSKEYKQLVQTESALKLNNMLKELPSFCKTFFNGKRSLSKTTALLYAHDLKSFFIFLAVSNPVFTQKIKLTNDDGVIRILDAQVTLDDMALLSTDDIEEYASYLEREGNSKESVEHYLSALSSLYNYNVKNHKLASNPVDGIERTKQTRKEVVTLSRDEKSDFLDTVEFGTGLTKKQLQYHKRNKERDYAIYKLFLSTGMRISELAGIDIEDIDFKKKSVSIIRKGGDAQKVFFSDSCNEALLAYLSVRNDVFHPLDEERALFLSPQGKRLSVRAIQMLTKNYVNSALPNKTEKITPHKLRSTFATETLEETGNIKLVSKALGHKNVTTTEIYADYMDDELEQIRNITDY